MFGFHKQATDKCTIFNHSFRLLSYNHSTHLAEPHMDLDYTRKLDIFMCLGLINGNFEMDIGDGELRYNVSYFYDNGLLNFEEIFLRNLFVSFQVLDRYIPGIMSNIYTNVTPKYAINQIDYIINHFIY